MALGNRTRALAIRWDQDGQLHPDIIQAYKAMQTVLDLLNQPIKHPTAKKGSLPF